MVEYLQDVGVPRCSRKQGGADEISWDSNDPVKGVDLMRRDSERILIHYHEDVVPRVQPIGLEEQLFIRTPRSWSRSSATSTSAAGYALEMDTETEWVADRIIDTKTGKQSVSKLKPSWLLQATIYGAMTGLPVEYHSISRAKVPKITTALESSDMVFTPSRSRPRT